MATKEQEAGRAPGDTTGSANSSPGGKSSGSASGNNNNPFGGNLFSIVGKRTGLLTPTGGLTQFTGQQLKDLIHGNASRRGDTTPNVPSDPVTGKTYIDPNTGLPVGQVPQGQLTIGGPARTTPADAYTNTAETMAQQHPDQTPAGSLNLARAINSQSYYDNASRQYNARGLNGFLTRNANVLGFGYEQPDLSRPQTYAEGSPQIGLNPGDLVGSLASLGTGIPGLGFLGGQAWKATGQPDPVLTGGLSYDPQTGALATPPSAGTSTQVARATGGAGGAGGTTLPSATPAATLASTASTPLQAQPAAASSASPGFQAFGQKTGNTIISGGNTIAPAWPWNTL